MRSCDRCPPSACSGAPAASPRIRRRRACHCAGIGPSGVSRTLVLIDGVPFNDPFGGWISWTRVPRPLDRADRGGRGIRGQPVRQLLDGRRDQHPDPDARRVLDRQRRRSTASGAPPLLDASAAMRRGAWIGILDGGLVRTDGYPVVSEDERGAVDENVAAESQRRLYASAGYAFPAVTVCPRQDGLFDESRQNGKRSTIDDRTKQNDTEWLSGRPASGRSGAPATRFACRCLRRSRPLPQQLPRGAGPRHRRAASANDARTVRPVLERWRRRRSGPARPGRALVLTGGIDWRRVEGESREDGLDPQTGTRTVLRRRRAGSRTTSASSRRAS